MRLILAIECRAHLNSGDPSNPFSAPPSDLEAFSFSSPGSLAVADYDNDGDLDVVVEVSGTHTRGMTLVDERGWGMGLPANTMVAYDPDSAGILDLVHQAAVMNRHLD